MNGISDSLVPCNGQKGARGLKVRGIMGVFLERVKLCSYKVIIMSLNHSRSERETLKQINYKVDMVS